MARSDKARRNRRKENAMTEITVKLTVAEQRKLIEREVGEHCFRFRLREDEIKAIQLQPNLSLIKLSDGSYAMWRTVSSLYELMCQDSRAGLDVINRMLPDDVT